MALIELDTSTPWQPPPPSRSRRTSAVAGLVAVVVLALLTGPSAAPGPGPLPLAWEVPTYRGFFWVTAQAVYTIDPPPPGHPNGLAMSLVARDPATGSPRWSYRIST